MQLRCVSRVTQNCVISHVCWVSPGLGMALPGTGRQVRSGGNGPLTMGGMGLVLSFPWVQLSLHMLVLGLCPHEESLVTGPSGDVVPGLTAPEGAREEQLPRPHVEPPIRCL